MSKPGQMDIFIKGNLKMIHFMARDDIPHPLVIAMKENGNMENGKVKARLYLPLATAIRENGKMI